MDDRARTEFRPVRCSLRDLVGDEYCEAVARARAFVAGEEASGVRARLSEKVDCHVI